MEAACVDCMSTHSSIAGAINAHFLLLKMVHHYPYLVVHSIVGTFHPIPTGTIMP